MQDSLLYQGATPSPGALGACTLVQTLGRALPQTQLSVSPSALLQPSTFLESAASRFLFFPALGLERVEAKWVELHSKGPNWELLRCSQDLRASEPRIEPSGSSGAFGFLRLLEAEGAISGEMAYLQAPHDTAETPGKRRDNAPGESAEVLFLWLWAKNPALFPLCSKGFWQERQRPKRVT